jgi:hypothetical protein
MKAIVVTDEAAGTAVQTEVGQPSKSTPAATHAVRTKSIPGSRSNRTSGPTGSRLSFVTRLP